MQDQLKKYIEGLRDIGYTVSENLIDERIAIKYPSFENEYNIFIDVSFPFPYEFPQIYLDKTFREVHKVNAHVFRGDSLCLKFSGKEMCNPNEPIGILVHSLKKAIGIIDRAFEGNLNEERFLELDEYWVNFGKKTYKRVYSFCKESDIRDLKFGYYFEEEYELYIFDSKSNTLGSDYFKRIKKFDLEKAKQCIFIEIETKEIAFVISEFKFLLQLLYHKKNEKIIDYLNSHRNEGLIVLVVKDLRNRKYALKFEFREYVNKTIKKNVQDKSKLNAMNYDSFNYIPMEMNQAQLFNRSSDGVLNTKYDSICIVGCGSIGSYVAEMYASIGVKSITLIDNDIMTDKNLLRHVCGKKSIYKSKVIALSEYLLDNFPYLEIQTYVKSIYEIDFNNFHNNQFDLVIIATGEITSEYYCLDQFLRGEKARESSLFWVEPFGVSCHVLKYNRTKWLMADFDSLSSNIKSISSVRNQEDFFQDDFGCNSAYIPYSSLYIKKFLSTYVLDERSKLSDCFTYTMLTNIEYGLKTKGIHVNRKYLNSINNEVVVGEVYD